MCKNSYKLVLLTINTYVYYDHGTLSIKYITTDI